MVDYKSAWKKRLIQIIIVNVIFLALGIYYIVTSGDFITGLGIWFFGSWTLLTIIATFGKSEDKISSLGRNLAVSIFSGIFAATSGGSTLMVFLFVIAIIKAIVGMMVLAVIFVFEYIAFPITTIYYFVKARQQ